MRVNFYRNSFKLKSDISTFFKRYRIVIICLSCVFILGLVTGIFTSSSFSGDLELGNIPDANFVAFLTNEKGSFGLFFSYFISIFIAIILIVFCNFNWFCSFINYFYIFVKGYILGFTIFSIIGLYSLAGIINTMLILIPFWLLINFLLILISSVCISKNRLIKKYGKTCYCQYNPKQFLIFLCILLTAVLFLFCMICPIIKITIIVN